MISFLFGFPAGLALAAHNWYRLGRRLLAIAHVIAGVVALLLLLLVTAGEDADAGLAGVVNLAIAVYLYVRTRASLADAERAGLVVQGGGAAAGLATVLAGWAFTFVAAVVLAVVLEFGAWAIGAPATGVEPEPAGSAAVASPTPTLGASAAGTVPTPGLGDCPELSVTAHQAPDVEALLPRRVQGRDLATWSVAGWCWLQLNAGDEALEELSRVIQERSIDVATLRFAVAGRSDTRSDPAYFVFAAARPLADDEIDVALFLLLAGAGLDAPVVDLADYEMRELDGRTYFVGTAEMVHQTEHQRGRPYLYQTDTAMFVIITDDDAWAEDAIGQLPCCWGH